MKIESANGLWFVDSVFHHIQGDGIQVGDQNNAASAINKVYIGRNQAHHNLQSCFWTKNATDVIMSENVCSDITFSPGGDGQGMGGQYDPKHVWFLYNTIYNTKAGIKVSGASAGTGGPWYMIGNRIHAVQSDSCNNYDMGALSFRNSGGATMLFNTIHDVDMFVAVPTGTGITVRNNIFSSQPPPAAPPSTWMFRSATITTFTPRRGTCREARPTRSSPTRCSSTPRPAISRSRRAPPR